MPSTDDDVGRIALSLPATAEKPSYGTPGFRVRDKLFARVREEGDVLVVWCEDLGEKAAASSNSTTPASSDPSRTGGRAARRQEAAVRQPRTRRRSTRGWPTRR
jgi:hypothetical protein